MIEIMDEGKYSLNPDCNYGLTCEFCCVSHTVTLYATLCCNNNVTLSVAFCFAVEYGWTPKEPITVPSDFLRDILAYLESMFASLRLLPVS